MNVVVLAAGKGRRMHSELPKVLHPIGGEPMLGHVLGAAVAAGAKRLVVVVGHGAEAVEAYVRGLTWLPTDAVRFALQDPPLGTGHAVQAATSSLSDDFDLTLVLYGDVPLIEPATLRDLAEAARAADKMAVLTTQLGNPTGYGRIIRGEQGHVLRSVEEKDATPEQRAIQEVNTGILIAPTKDLQGWVAKLENHNAQSEFYLTDVIAMASQEGRRVLGVNAASAESTEGVNTLAQRAEMERRYQRRRANELMEAGTTIADPSRFDVRGQLQCGPGVSIDVGCIFEGHVELAEGVEIGPHCVLRNVVVGAGSRIEAFSHLDGAVLGRQAVVGPYARLRPGTELAEGCHIGNFTEVKNSQIGPYSKANHLSYVGDSTVGARVNIGAGTITCNYDGAEKHRTIIEDDVFIGSDTQLVAPVIVHEGATLGAGTTLTTDAPAHQLTVSRARQASIPNWKRPKKKSH